VEAGARTIGAGLNQVGAEGVRWVALVVVAAPLLLVALLPLLAAVTSTGLLDRRRCTSRMRMSGNAAAAENVTVTEFAPAAASHNVLGVVKSTATATPLWTVGPPRVCRCCGSCR